jgi:CBS-domain-containing membrane protein
LACHFDKSDSDLLFRQPVKTDLEGRFMSVGQICVREVDTADADESVAAAARRMHDRAVGTLVVVDDYARVVGIVTDRDFVSRVLAKGLSPAVTEVGEVMTSAPSTVSEDTSIEDALAMMRSGRFRRVPVVDETNKLQGLITLDDVLMLLAEEFMQVGRILNGETPRAVIEDQQGHTSARSRTTAR